MPGAAARDEATSTSVVPKGTGGTEGEQERRQELGHSFWCKQGKAAGRAVAVATAGVTGSLRMSRYPRKQPNNTTMAVC